MARFEMGAERLRTDDPMPRYAERARRPTSKAKGMNLLHMRNWVLQRYGETGWQRVVRALAPPDATVVASLVPVGWYDLSLQHRLVRTIDHTLGDGDLRLVPSIGRYEADQDLTRIHRLFLRLATPGFVLEKAGNYWSRLYDGGEWEVVRDTPNSARGVLRGLAPPDPAFCVYLWAYIEKMFRLTGVQGGNLTHTACVTRGADACVFEGTWND